MSIAHDKPKSPRSSGAQCVNFILKIAYRGCGLESFAGYSVALPVLSVSVSGEIRRERDFPPASFFMVEPKNM